MATLVHAKFATFTNDAEFRAFGQPISAFLAAAGLVQTADTGQINWTTVTKPATTNTVAGYEIWRFNDALQATAPVFLKLEYGTGTTNVPSFWITVGSGSDGTGNLTGVLSTRTQTNCNTSITGTRNFYLSAAAGRLALVSDAASATQMIVIVIERTKDATGADTAEGVHTITSGGGGAKQQAWFPAGAGTQEATWGVLLPQTAQGANGSQVAVFPFFLTKGAFLYPPMGVLAYIASTITLGVPFTLSMYGADHTFIGATANVSSSQVRVSAANGALAIRWE